MTSTSSAGMHTISSAAAAAAYYYNTPGVLHVHVRFETMSAFPNDDLAISSLPVDLEQ